MPLTILILSFGVIVAGVELAARGPVASFDATYPILAVAAFLLFPLAPKRALVIGLFAYLVSFSIVGGLTEYVRSNALFAGNTVLYPLPSSRGLLVRVNGGDRRTRAGRVYVARTESAVWRVRFSYQLRVVDQGRHSGSGINVAGSARSRPLPARDSQNGQVALVVNGAPAATATIPVSKGWLTKNITFRLDPAQARVWLQFTAPPHEQLDVARVSVRAGAAGARSGDQGRFSGPYQAPNLAGHSMALSSLLLVALSTSPMIIVLAWLLGVVSVLLSGSRIAFALVMLISLPVVLTRSLRKRIWLGLATLCLAALVLLTLGSWFGHAFVRDASHPLPSRLQVLSAAWRAMVRGPWYGAGLPTGSTISRFLQAGLGHVVHAHDLVLQYAVADGYLGLVAAVAFSVLLVVLSGTRFGLRGFLASGAVIFLNLLDFTIWSVGVYLPFVLFMTAVSVDHRERRGDTNENA